MRKKHIPKKIISSLSALITAFGCISSSLSVFADDVITPTKSETYSQMQSDYYTLSDVSYSPVISYSDYFDIYSLQNRPETEIIINASDYSDASGDNISVGKYKSENDVLIWNGSDGEVTYNFDTSETGIYCINMTYYPIESNLNETELSLEIDGKAPYDTAKRIMLNRIWVNKNDISEDSRGNQIKPVQVQSGMWISSDFNDTDGLFNEPLIFYLEKGNHAVTFKSEKANIAIESFKFYNPEKLCNYSEYASSVKSSVSIEDTQSNLIRLEGENADFKSSAVLSPSYDNNDYTVSPSDPRKIVYNTIGKDSWNKAFQSITWTIPADSIKSDGWYKIGIKARQNKMRGLYSNRRIYIDGKVPCNELNQIRFFYDNDWKRVSPKTSDGDYVYIYLSADTDHSITLEAVPGDIGNSLRRLDDIVAELNTYYRKILMITGPAPDKYTDYYVHEKIPELLSEFEKLSSQLKEVQSEIEKLSNATGSEAAVIERTAVTLDKCTDKPLKIPEYLYQIKDGITSLSARAREYRDQPLEIDYIELASADRKFTSVEKKLTKSIKFGCEAFIGSFFEDYTTLSDIKNEEAIEIWVNNGREQAQIIKQLAESDFMEKYDIPVAVNLVSGGIVEAALAGKEPDVALFIGGEFPVTLASRGLITDLSQFDDFNDISKRFQKNACIPYQYNNGCYALPVSQVWPMMFYRTDILSELGIDKPPQTWQELIDMLPAIQRNYMSAGLVLPSANTSPATECGHTFAMLMLQQGMTYYSEDLSASTLDSNKAVNAFEMWTDFYTDYSFEQSYDAFSRFRTGEYPIVISNYTFYNQLTAASPEIKGLWDFTSVPGTMNADGEISHAVNSNGSGAVIFSSCANKKGAWEFIKWFTSDEIQTEYAVQTEGILGTLGRFDTANTAALSNLSWSDNELEKLMTQRNEISEIPIIPASYAVTRNIMNAFREAVNKSENPRDTLLWYNKDINEEIIRKNKTLK